LDLKVGEDRMANLTKAVVCLASKTARPNWTLAAFASLLAAGIAASLRYAFG
jgi:hypothetical protein